MPTVPFIRAPFTFRTSVAFAAMLVAVSTFWISRAGAAPADVTVCHDAAIGRQRTEIDADVALPRFDAALGTLTEVTVPVQSIHLDTDATFENIAASAVTFAEQMTYSVAFTSPSGLPSPTALSGTVVRIPTQVLAAFDGTFDFAGPSAVTQPSVGRDESAGAVASTDPAVLAAFTGTGTVPFHVATTISETFMGGGGNVQAAINTYASASVQVCYRYQPTVVVPPSEPPVEVAGSVVTRVPTLPATGSSTIPLTLAAVASIAVGTVLARRYRTERPSLAD